MLGLAWCRQLHQSRSRRWVDSVIEFCDGILVVTSKSKLFTAACHNIIWRHNQFQIFNFHLRALKCRSKYFDFKIVAEEMTRQKNWKIKIEKMRSSPTFVFLSDIFFFQVNDGSVNIRVGHSYGDKRERLGGSIAQRLAHLLPVPTAPGSILGVPNFPIF